jgi:N-acetylneuraminic acid mutarotase
MSRRLPLTVVLGLAAFGLGGCGEGATPSEPLTVAASSASALSLTAASNTWTTKAPLPGFPRKGLAAGVVNNTAGQPILYVFGGHFQNFTHRTIQAYDLAADSWSATGSFLEVDFSNGAGNIRGTLYLSGGYVPRAEDNFIRTRASIVAATYAYSPAANTVTRVADMPRHTGSGVSAVIDNKLYVLAGSCGPDCATEVIRRLYFYDPRLNSWATKAWCPRYHRNGSGGAINGKFYVAGGTGPGGAPVASLDVYDPATNTWKALAPMPDARAGAAGAVLQNKLFAIGGTGARGDRSAYSYDPVTNTWKTRASLLTGQSGLAAGQVTLDGQSYILAVAGTSNSDLPNPNELYTP